MKKLAIAFVAILSLSACNKSNSAAHSQFVKMCQDDPRAKEQGFDCGCQADIIQSVLKTEEMDKLVEFLNVEKKDPTKALEMGKDPQFTPMFQKIAGIGLAIHDKCGNPTKAAAAAPAADSVKPATAPAGEEKSPEAKPTK